MAKSGKQVSGNPIPRSGSDTDVLSFSSSAPLSLQLSRFQQLLSCLASPPSPLFTCLCCKKRGVQATGVRTKATFATRKRTNGDIKGVQKSLILPFSEYRHSVEGALAAPLTPFVLFLKDTFQFLPLLHPVFYLFFSPDSLLVLPNTPT